MRATGRFRSRVGRPSGGGAPAPIARLTKKDQVLIRGIPRVLRRPRPYLPRVRTELYLHRGRAGILLLPRAGQRSEPLSGLSGAASGVPGRLRVPAQWRRWWVWPRAGDVLRGVQHLREGSAGPLPAPDRPARVLL